jgi:hypothetical protein
MDSETLKTLEVLKLRNAQLRMQQAISELEIRSLQTELANWKQIALLAVEKIKLLEQ